MKFHVLFLLLFGFCRSAPHEGLPLLNPGGIGGIFEGPGSETIIRGPDGSEITSEQKSGAVIQDDGLSKQPIVVAEPEVAVPPPVLTDERRFIQTGPIVSSTAGSPSSIPLLTDGEPYYNTAGQALISSTAAPILSPSSPSPLLTGETYGPSPAPNSIISGAPLQYSEVHIASSDTKPIEIVEQDPHIIETEIIEAPGVETDESVDIKGSSGRIITKGSASIVSGPASTTITEPRKIIVAPPKIAIGTPVVATASIPLLPLSALGDATGASFSAAAPPALSYSTTAAPPALSYSTAAAPPTFSYSTTAAPADLGYSTTAAPRVTAGIDSSRIDLGAGASRESIPVVEYSASNGVINGQDFAPGGYSSSTEAPAVISSTISTINTGNFGSSERPAAPAAYLLPPAAPTNPVSTGAGSYNIQKIPRIEDSVAVDGRVDLGESPYYEKSRAKAYQLPHVLSAALSSLYRKSPKEYKTSVLVDDKMGELAQNEIISSFPSAPDLSQARYIGPALARNGIDASQVNLAPVPLSQVTRLPDGGPLGHYYYKRSANPRK